MPKWQELRVRSICLRVLCAGGRAVDIGIMPHLPPTADHAACVVIGAGAAVDRWSWRERSRCGHRGWCFAGVDLRHRRDAMHLGGLPTRVARAANRA